MQRRLLIHAFNHISKCITIKYMTIKNALIFEQETILCTVYFIFEQIRKKKLVTENTFSNGTHISPLSLTIISEPSWHPSNIRIWIQMPQKKICANFQIESPSQIYSLYIHCTILHAFVCVWYLNCDLSLFFHLQTSKLYCH